MDPVEKFSGRLTQLKNGLLDLSGIFDVEVVDDSIAWTDLTPLREGRYTCANNIFEHAYIESLCINSPEKAFGFGGGGASGFFRNVSRANNLITGDICWDDGSGRSRIEHLRMELLADEQFSLTNSDGHTNIYTLTDDS